MGETIKTRFSLGERVWKLSQDRATFELPCVFCRGTGRFKVTGAAERQRDVDCPECRGYRHDGIGGGLGRPAVIRFGAAPTWSVSTAELTIGMIEARRFDHSQERPEQQHREKSNRDPSWQREDEDRYMCWETGVGGGSVYGGSSSNSDIFGSEEEAAAEADRRSAAALAGDGWKPSADEFRVATGFLDHRDVYEHEPEHIETAEQIIAAYEAAEERR